MRALDVPGGIAAAIVIDNPGVAERRQPFVFAGHAGPETVPAVLLETADAIASTQFGEKAAPSGAWAALSRLAFPVGVGPGTALADEGIDGVTISPAGELPPEPAAADGARISTDNLFATGTTALNLLLTLDETDRSITAGPQNYVQARLQCNPGLDLRAPGDHPAAALAARRRRRLGP